MENRGLDAAFRSSCRYHTGVRNETSRFGLTYADTDCILESPLHDEVRW